MRRIQGHNPHTGQWDTWGEHDETGNSQTRLTIDLRHATPHLDAGHEVTVQLRLRLEPYEDEWARLEESA